MDALLGLAAPGVRARARNAQAAQLMRRAGKGAVQPAQSNCVSRIHRTSNVARAHFSFNRDCNRTVVLRSWKNHSSDVIGGFLDGIESGVDLRGIETSETQCSFRKTKFSASRQVH